MKTFEERTAYMEKEPKNGWRDTLPAPEKVKALVLHQWGFSKGGYREWSPSILSNPLIDEDTYEFWCKLWWCMNFKLKPLSPGKSYKLAILKLIKGEYDNG